MKNEQLISTLQRCAAQCLHCADACLDEDNLKKMVSCIRTDRACAETCSATARILAMNGANAEEMVRLCKDICAQCADECEKHEHQHCQDCAKACRECEKACASYMG